MLSDIPPTQFSETLQAALARRLRQQSNKWLLPPK